MLLLLNTTAEPQGLIMEPRILAMMLDPMKMDMTGSLFMMDTEQTWLLLVPAVKIEMCA